MNRFLALKLSNRNPIETIICPLCNIKILNDDYHNFYCHRCSRFAITFNVENGNVIFLKLETNDYCFNWRSFEEYVSILVKKTYPSNNWLKINKSIVNDLSFDGDFNIEQFNKILDVLVAFQ